MTIKVDDNYLDLQSFLIIRDLCFYTEKSQFKDPLPWYWSAVLLEGTYDGDLDNNFQFCHKFYNNDYPQSPHIKYIEDLMDEMMKTNGARSFVRIKANLNPRSAKIIRHGFHIDVPKEWADDVTTSIYYVNSNNGYTEFEDGTKIESVENRLVSFPAKMRHSGTTCTDKQARVVINFNYF